MRLLPVVLLLACSEEAPLPPSTQDAAARDASGSDASEVDAGRFCDEAELEDGILCTAGVCREEEERIDQLPDDSRCMNLDRNPTCGTGTAAGFLVEAIGRCDPSEDCRREWRSILDCRGPSRRYCAAGAIMRDDPGCLTASSTCGAVTTVERDCAEGVPEDDCDGLTFHYGARGQCTGEPPSCSLTEATEQCTARSPSCSGGFITVWSAGCDPSLGCTETSTVSSCFDPPSACNGDVLTTYTPTCDGASACGIPLQSSTACSGHTECNGRVHSVYAPACDPIAERCEETLASQTDCSYLDDCFCTGVPPSATQTIVTGFCSVQSGCDFATSPPVPCPTECRCTPTRVCN